MADLIERSAIKYHEQLESFGNGMYKPVKIAYMSDIDALPAVDAVPVVHGRWVDGHCSECGCDIPAYIDDWKWVKDMDAKFCPQCGAKMDGKDNIESVKQNIDGMPVRHGRWMWELYGARCSVCNYALQTTGLPSECPKCGAVMDGKDGNE